MKNSEYRACIDYLIKNFIDKGNYVMNWKTTQKNLVVYGYDGKRTMIPLAEVFGS